MKNLGQHVRCAEGPFSVMITLARGQHGFCGLHGHLLCLNNPMIPSIASLRATL